VTLLGAAVVAGVVLAGLSLAAALDVDRRRRSLPRGLGLAVLGVAFTPVIALEAGAVPWTGDAGMVAAVIAAVTLYIAAPLLLASIVGPAGTPSPAPDTVGTHVCPGTDTYAAGTYRVVGAADRIALLRVTDGAGRRIHGGSVIHVDAATLDSSFESAPDPDSGINPVRALRSEWTGLVWRVRGLLGR